MIQKLFSLGIGILMTSTALATQISTAGKGATKVAADQVGIQFFDGSWQDALATAKKEKKLIFMDAYAAWCRPCKIMAEGAFKEKAVGEFFNEHFINFKMDMEKHAEGPRLSKKYELFAYPSLYFIDMNEVKVHQSVGALNEKELIELGNEALKK